MKFRIKDIASIQTGVYEKPVPFGNIFYIQARNFDKDNQINDTILSSLTYNIKFEKHFLKPGDVLVASKGYDHFAATFKGFNKPAVASSMFFVIKLTNSILPEYLTWYINHFKTQSIISGKSKGTALPSIKKQDIENLEILIPSIEKQKLVLQLSNLRQQEIQLKKLIEELNETIIQQQIFNAINK